MSEKSSSSSSRGIGFTGLLTIAFVVLKLTGVIDWTWFWVLSPVIFATIIGLILFVIVIGLAIWANK